MTTPIEPSENALLGEYAAANSVYLAYDGFRWQAGSFLIAGVFVFWGFLIAATAASPLILGLASLLVAALMSCWLLFANHYRQLYRFKLMRLHEIEKKLGLQQHLRFTGELGTRQKAFGPAGHNIDVFVYLLTTIGSGVLAVFVAFSWLDVLVVPLAVWVILWVRFNERRLTGQLRDAYREQGLSL